MKIFVAHSFKAHDKTAVAAFIEFLKAQGHEVLTGEKAEAKPVIMKVRERIRSCDLFIAFFTKENVIYEDGFINRVKGKISAHTFSLWVFHELSFAMGLDKPFIMLIEDCIVDSIPNFHGDTENIRFSRDNPANSFLRLTEMLMALNTKQAETIAEPSQPPPEEEEPSKQDQAVEKEKGKNFIDEYFEAMSEGKVDEVIRIFNDEIKKEIQDEDDLIFWDSLTWRIAYRNGKTDAFKNLESLPDRYKNIAQAHLFLGDAFRELGAYEKADENYNHVLQNAELSTEKGQQVYVEARKKLALSLAVSKHYEDAIDLLIVDLKDKKLLSQKATIATALARMAKDAEDTDRFHYFAEYALSINPSDSKLRFDLAYSYSQKSLHKLALLHYRIIVSNSNAHSFALNNIGVEYDRLGLNLKGSSYYRKAAEKKETLAMANLAHNFVNAGCEDEARKLLKEAEQLSSEGIEVSERVGIVKSSLEEELKKEGEKESKILEDAEAQRRFGTNFASARICENDFNFEGRWKNETIDIQIKVVVGKIAVNDSRYLPYDIDGTIVNNFLLQDVKIDGKIEGNSAICQFELKRIMTSEKRNFTEKEIKGKAWLYGLKDSNKIEAMLVDGEKITFEQWNRVEC